jgi:hypothetical protein
VPAVLPNLIGDALGDNSGCGDADETFDDLRAYEEPGLPNIHQDSLDGGGSGGALDLDKEGGVKDDQGESDMAGLPDILADSLGGGISEQDEDDKFNDLGDPGDGDEFGVKGPAAELNDGDGGGEETGGLFELNGDEGQPETESNLIVGTHGDDGGGGADDSRGDVDVPAVLPNLIGDALGEEEPRDPDCFALSDNEPEDAGDREPAVLGDPMRNAVAGAVAREKNPEEDEGDFAMVIQSEMPDVPDE